MSIIDLQAESAPSEIDALAQEIREKSEEVRGSLADRVSEFKEQVDQLFDWSHYVCEHPWAIASIAGALGYALAPRLRGRTEAEETRPCVAPSLEPTSAAENVETSGSLPMAGLLREIALQTAITFTARQAVRYVHQLLQFDPAAEEEQEP